ncbi:MAG: hypothetical protein AAFV95_17420 [Bacteroidota bacterium]
MEEARKHLLDSFHKRLLQDYETYCDTHCFDKSTDGLVTYLIDQGLIQSPTIKRYTIQKEFDELYPDGNQKKTQVVDTLANRFNISSRSVWSMLR